MKLLMRITLATLLLFVLAACGGDEAAQVEQESDTAQTELSTEEESDSDVAEESAVDEHDPDGDDMDEAAEDEDDAGHDEDASDADESHEMDEDEEADSDEDDDLEAGHDQDSDDDQEMDDDAQHDAEMEEDSIDDDEMSVAAAGEGWGESGTTAQTACDHPYMPLRQGAIWSYEGSEGELDWEVTSVEGDMEEATAVIHVSGEDFDLEYTWACAAGQGLSSFDFGTQGLSNTFPEMTMELTEGEGSFLPPAEEMVPGYSWDSDYEQTMTFVVGEGDEQVEATGDIVTEQTSTILSAGPIAAAGITAEGVQVEQISDMTIVMNMMGTAVEQAQTLSNIFDLGWGIGIMKQLVQSEFGQAEMDLISFYVP